MSYPTDGEVDFGFPLEPAPIMPPPVALPRRTPVPDAGPSSTQLLRMDLLRLVLAAGTHLTAASAVHDTAIYEAYVLHGDFTEHPPDGHAVGAPITERTGDKP